MQGGMTDQNDTCRHQVQYSHHEGSPVGSVVHKCWNACSSSCNPDDKCTCWVLYSRHSDNHQNMLEHICKVNSVSVLCANHCRLWLWDLQFSWRGIRRLLSPRILCHVACRWVATLCRKVLPYVQGKRWASREWWNILLYVLLCLMKTTLTLQVRAHGAVTMMNV